MEKYKIYLNGCDDTTEFEMELTEEEYKFLNKVAELSEKHSSYQCMPTMSVSKIE